MTHRLEAREELDGVLVSCVDCGIRLAIPVALPDCEPLVIGATTAVAPARPASGPEGDGASAQVGATGRVESGA